MKKKFLPTFFFVLILFFLLVCVYFVRQVTHVDEDTDFPIDLVYLWVDGSDEAWLAKKEYWQRRLGEDKEYAVSKARWRDREELKHWLNTEHPKIEIVDHKDIFPLDALPVFNSMAIETRLPFIPGLSEHFIYMNDDMFINVPLTPDYFFKKDGTPIVYGTFDYKPEVWEDLARNQNKMWAQTVIFSFDKMYEKFGVKNYGVFGTHTTSSYRKSDFMDALNVFKDEFSDMTYAKFRKVGAGRDLVDQINYVKHRGDFRDFLQGVDSKFNCSYAGLLIMNNMHDLKKNPCTFCLNDTQDLQGEFNLAHTHYLRQRFPKKSSFEK